MKRYILTLLLAAFACTACDKDDEYEIREWTVSYTHLRAHET